MRKVGANEKNATVLVVPSFSMEPYYRIAEFHESCKAIQDIRNLISAEGFFFDRDRAERDPSLIQIVAYGLLRHDNRLLCMQRSARSSRASLRLKYSVLFGGHVDDRNSSKPIEACVVREFREELGVRCSIQDPRLLGIAADSTTAVGRQHLGVVFDIRHPRDSINLTPDQDTIEFAASGRLGRHRFYRPVELGALEGRFDPWSRLFLASESAARILRIGEPLVRV